MMNHLIWLVVCNMNLMTFHSVMSLSLTNSLHHFSEQVETTNQLLFCLMEHGGEFDCMNHWDMSFGAWGFQKKNTQSMRNGEWGSRKQSRPEHCQIIWFRAIENVSRKNFRRFFCDSKYYLSNQHSYGKTLFQRYITYKRSIFHRSVSLMDTCFPFQHEYPNK